MHTRAVALMTIMSTTQCSEWVPASVAQATGQERVRVRREASLEEPISTEPGGRVVTTELELPSRQTLVRMRHEGGHFEVRRSNAENVVVPVTLAIVGGAVLSWLVLLAAQYKPSFDVAAVAAGLPRPP